MAAPRFWLASSSKRPRCKAVVTSLVAAWVGEDSRQRAVQMRAAKPKPAQFKEGNVVFITVCFIFVAFSLMDSPRLSCHPFVKLDCPLNRLNMRKDWAES